jgi:hypothetical protein
VSPRPTHMTGGEALHISRAPSRRIATEVSAYSITAGTGAVSLSGAAKAGAQQQQQQQQHSAPGQFAVKPMEMPSVAGNSRAAGGDSILKPRRSGGSLTVRMSVGSKADGADAGEDGGKRQSLERLKQVGKCLIKPQAQCKCRVLARVPDGSGFVSL